MTLDYTALKTEIATDPNGYGYAAPYAAGDLIGVAALLNEVRATIDIDRELVPTHEIFEAIVPTEWAALVAQEKQRVSMVLSLGEVNLKGANTRLTFTEAFGAGTTTRANLLALLTRNGSRSEQLFGMAVRHEDVAKARDI